MGSFVCKRNDGYMYIGEKWMLRSASHVMECMGYWFPYFAVQESVIRWNVAVILICAM